MALSHKSRLTFLSVSLLALLAACCGCGVPSADGPADSYGVDFTLPPGSRTDGAVIFIVDGINSEIFQDMLAKGQLPAIKKYFVDRGLLAPRAVASHPSITMNNLTTLVTGKFPGHESLLAPKTFDRNELIFRNYETLDHKNRLDEDYRVSTLYERFSDRLTFSLFLQPHRGATKFYENRTSAGPAMAFNMYDLVDRIALHRFSEVMDVARKYRQFPAITTVYLLSVNFHAYQYGVWTPQYRQALADTDRQVGRVLGDMQRAGLLDKVVIALVSDHGHCDTPKHALLEAFLKDSLGVAASSAEPTPAGESFEHRLAHYNQVAAVTYGCGDRYWTLHLRKPIRKDGKVVGLENWLTVPSPEDLLSYPASNGRLVNLPAELSRREGVDAVTYRSAPDKVRVVRSGGEVEFTRTIVKPPGGAPATGAKPTRTQILFSYRVISGDDPLGYKAKVPAELLSGRPADQRQWLRGTLDSDFPDLPIGLFSYFDAKLAADIVVFPAPLWDCDGWRKAGHGGIRNFEMLAPMMLAGPGVPHVRLDGVRTVDLTPTILQLLGRPAAEELDGQSLLDQP